MPHLRGFSGRAPVIEDDERRFLFQILTGSDPLLLDLGCQFLALGAPIVDRVHLGAPQAHKLRLVHWTRCVTIFLLCQLPNTFGTLQLPQCFLTFTEELVDLSKPNISNFSFISLRILPILGDGVKEIKFLIQLVRTDLILYTGWT